MKSNEDQNPSPVAAEHTGTRKPYTAPAIEVRGNLCRHQDATEICFQRAAGELGADEGIPRLVALWCHACGALGDRQGERWQFPSSAVVAAHVRALQDVPLSLTAQVTRWRRIELAAVATSSAHVELETVIESPAQWFRHDGCVLRFRDALRSLLEVLGGVASVLIALVVVAGCSGNAAPSAEQSPIRFVHESDAGEVVQLDDRDAAALEVDAGETVRKVGNGFSDAGALDAGAPKVADAGTADAGTHQVADAGTADAGTHQVADAGTADAGPLEVDAGDTRPVCAIDQSVVSAACTAGHCAEVCDWIGAQGGATVCCGDPNYQPSVFRCVCPIGGAQ